MQDSEADIIVVGAGLAGLSAALTARERGAKVVVLECAPEEERGGNTRFSNGAMRAVYQGLADVEELVGEIGTEERAHTDRQKQDCNCRGERFHRAEAFTS